MTRALFLFAVLATTSGLAATQVVVSPFAGPKASSAQGPVEATLCQAQSCVPFSRVSTGGKLDWAKVKSAGVGAVLLGKVGGTKKKPSLELTLAAEPQQALYSQSYPLSATGKPSAGTLQKVGRDLASVLDGLNPPPPAPVAPAPVIASPAPTPSRAKPPDAAAKPAPVETIYSERAARPPMVVGELGLEVMGRTLRYDGLTTRNLRPYTAGFPTVVSPRFHLEVYPLSRLMRGVPARLGAEIDYLFTVGLSSALSEGPTFPTRMSQLNLGLRYHQPLGVDTEVGARLGYRTHDFALLPASDGTVIEGLPPINYAAVRVGLFAEQRLLSQALALGLDLAVLPVLSSPDLVGPSFFPRGSALGFEAGLSVGYQLIPKLEARVGGRFTQYGLSFDSQAGDAFAASAATDRYFGATVGLRYAY